MNEPQEIRMSERVKAVLIHRHYKVDFPYSEEAVSRMSLCPTAHYERSLGWSVSAWKHEALSSALKDIEEICQSLGFDTQLKDVPLTRSVVLFDPENPPKFLDGPEGKEKVVKLGRPFTATRATAKASGLKITGKEVCYAYHRPATELELEALIEKQAQREEVCDLSPA